MTTLSRAPGPIASVELGAALARALRNRLGATTGIARIERRDFPSATSYPIEEFAVVLKNGTELTLLLKNLAVGAMLPGARAAKPALVQDPRREIHVYKWILDGAGLGTADCYLAHSDEERGRYWLALERVAGVELFQVGDLEVWKQVARWLAAAHSRLAAHALPGAERSPLLDYGPAFYRGWARRAYDFASDRDRLLLAPVVERYESVVEELVALPRTLIHGEFYASNILVGAGRVCAVDWEMAAIGPALVDLAALTAGHWSEADRRALAIAYYEADGTRALWPDRDRFLRALELCRLHLAMQWLGWSPDWTPPREHAQDWLGEALRCADRLGV